MRLNDEVGDLVKSRRREMGIDCASEGPQDAGHGRHRYLLPPPFALDHRLVVTAKVRPEGIECLPRHGEQVTMPSLPRVGGE